MAACGLDPLTKELIYLAVSTSNGCAYCIASHGAAAKKQGMTPEMLGELMAVVGMANETNSLANGYRVPVDEGSKNCFDVGRLPPNYGTAAQHRLIGNFGGPSWQHNNNSTTVQPRTSATSSVSNTSISASTIKAWRPRSNLPRAAQRVSPSCFP